MFVIRMKGRVWAVLALGAAFWLTPLCAQAQSFNIDLDIGTGGQEVGNGAPSSAFGAAANQPGYWNRISASGPSIPKLLKNLAGGISNARIFATGDIGNSVGFNNHSNSGDYRLLMNDAANPAPDASYHFDGLENGMYRVYTYACIPSGEIDQVEINVENAVGTNPQLVTGPMAGNTFEELVTHSQHLVSVNDGMMVVHVLRADPNLTPCVNGFQLVQVSSFVRALSLLVFRGFIQSGDISSVAASENEYLRVRSGLTLTSLESPVDVIFEGSTAILSPTVLSFRVEANADSGGLLQSISLFDFQSEKWTLLDSRQASLADSTIDVAAGANPSRFISASGTLRGRIAYRQSGPVSHFPWIASIDLVNWIITP